MISIQPIIILYCLYLWTVLRRMHLGLDMGPLGGATSPLQRSYICPYELESMPGLNFCCVALFQCFPPLYFLIMIK